MDNLGKIERVHFYWREEHPGALDWVKKTKDWIGINFPNIKISDESPQAVLVFGGDGTILSAAREYQKSGAMILGLNLGKVGFLASIGTPADFFDKLSKFFNGDYSVVKRMMLTASLFRDGEELLKADALNDVVVQSLVSVVEIAVSIEGYVIQTIRGTGVIASTATGSTAFNLSAHGPIIMPGIKGIIITEILDHNVPTPSIVIKYDRTVEFEILNYRPNYLLKDAKTGEPVEVVLSVDGSLKTALLVGDVIKISNSSHQIPFVELEPNHFFKSLQDRFSFK